MRIQYTNTPTTFGYNKQLNKDLKQKIKNDTVTNPDLLRTISSLNNFCNTTEDRLNKCNVEYDGELSEKDKIPSLLYGSLSPAKITLAGLVDATYPELNYTQREYDSYIAEANEIVNTRGVVFTWQFGLAAELGFILPPEATQDGPSESENDDSKGFEIIEAGDLTPDQWQKLFEAEQMSGKKGPMVNKDEKPITEIIQKFEPTISSPTGFESIGGMDSLKEELYDKIIFPALHPEEARLDFEEYGKRYPRGIMLYGPPGCGKTTIAQKFAAECQMNYAIVNAQDIASTFIHGTQRLVKQLFQQAEQNAPIVLILDEIETMVPNRNDPNMAKMAEDTNAFLSEMNNCGERGIFLIGTTNRPQFMDSAILRSGRFDKRVYVPVPDEQTRKEIFHAYLAGRPIDKSIDCQRLSRLTSGGYISSDIRRFAQFVSTYLYSLGLLFNFQSKN